MRDIVAAETAGVPAALAVIGWLDSIAVETRRVSGMADLPVIAIQETFFGRSRKEIANATRGYAPQIVGSVTAPGPA